jgi:hypothetical protein
VTIRLPRQYSARRARRLAARSPGPLCRPRTPALVSFWQTFAVPMSGAHRDEVVLAVGNRLSARGVDRSVNLSHQLTEVRRSDWGH